LIRRNLKKIVFYSPDFTMCTNLLLFLQQDYLVTTTTDVDILMNIMDISDVDLLLIDSEPNALLEEFLQDLRGKRPSLPIILTYVFKQAIQGAEENLRKYVNSIFYKPYDLNEVTKQLITLTLK
jgi:DNA-binding NtrC family response regulator